MLSPGLSKLPKPTKLCEDHTLEAKGVDSGVRHWDENPRPVVQLLCDLRQHA